MVLHWPIQSPYAYLRLHQLSVIVNHGHHLSEQNQEESAQKFKAGLFITGHTHIAALRKKENIIYLNPGSPCMSKRPDGKGTFALLENNRIQILDIRSGEIIMEEVCTII